MTEGLCPRWCWVFQWVRIIFLIGTSDVGRPMVVPEREHGRANQMSGGSRIEKGTYFMCTVERCEHRFTSTGESLGRLP